MEYKVSLVTVPQVLSELMKIGLIYRDRGRGTFVTEGVGLKRPILNGSIEDLIIAAKGTRIKILSYKEVRTLPKTAKIPQFRKAEKVFQLELVRTTGSVHGGMVRLVGIVEE